MFEILFEISVSSKVYSIFWAERTNLIRSDTIAIIHFPITKDTLETEDYFSIGFGLEFGAKIKPYRFFALGIDLETNLNFVKPTITPMLNLEF